MRGSEETLDRARHLFNSISVVRGQYVSIATAGTDGRPNVAPIGSMRIAEDGTVRVLQGFLGRTMRNLRENPAAAFAVPARPSLMEQLRFFRRREPKVLGYRVYGTLTSTSDSPDAVRTEVDAISCRIPALMRGPFRRFCDRNLKRLLTFSIDEVREIGGPER